MINLILSLIISLPCSGSFNHIKHVKAFTANFIETINSPALGKGELKGKVWYKNGIARINITSPDTEVILVKDSTIKTLNFADSTLIVQKKTEKTEFFYNLIKGATPDTIFKAGDTCFAVIKPAIETIDSIYIKFDSRGSPLNIELFQANTRVGVKLLNFREVENLPDSLFKMHIPKGFQTINF